MTLANGTKLGRYEIRSQIGAGGMGEVYRAHDEKLNRDVAIKVLPTAFSKDVNRLRRFEQEAQATGTLNHPNILAVYDVGVHEGAPYVVAELLEGETLRQRLNEGSLAQSKAMDYGVQISCGLAGAHEKAIVHRDLKPENILITKDDRVKILDFGLAKLAEPIVGGVAQTDIPTRQVHTDPGTVVGTVGYMSPEQVRGQHVDHRSDIFSFGVVFYEMLSGRRAFHGDSAIETLNAILKEEPAELSQTNTKVNPALERIVRRCLEKKPERRFQSAFDLTFAVEAVLTPSGSAIEPTALSPGVEEAQTGSRMWRLLRDVRLAWIVAALLLLGMLGFAWAYFKHQPAAEARVMKFSIMPPEKMNFDHIAVSPDGKWLAFTAATGGKVQLWLRALESLEAKAFAGTEGASNPFWSPDSRFIGFFAGGKLKKIEISGSLPSRLCDVRVGTGATWSRDGVILFSALGGSGLSRVSATGGEVASVIRPDWKRQETDFTYPFFLPDGRHFLYSKWSGQKETRGIYLGSLDGELNQRLLPDDSNAVYAASDKGEGYLLFGREGALMAQPFDAAQRQLTGEPFSVAGQVRTNLDNVISSRRRSFSVSENGVLVFDPFPNRKRNQLIWVDREGKQTGSLDGLDNVSMLRLSPDDKRFMVTSLEMQTGNNDLWLSDLTGGNATRFTFDPANDHFPVWSPDGNRIVWSSNKEGPYHLYEKATSGAVQDSLLLKSDYFKFPMDWSRDGNMIIYRENNPKTKYDVWVLPVGPQAGEQKPFPFLQTEANETTAVLSPDAQWLAYSSDEAGVYEIYVQSFPAGGGKRQVSRGGGIGPHWRGDGKELFYHAPDGKLMAVAVKDGASFEAGPAVALFDFRPGGNLLTAYYSVTADGQKFLLSTIVETEATAPLTVVINWTANLKR
jgi:eukaryotic-like serine/threonine-protein kinase